MDDFLLHRTSKNYEECAEIRKKLMCLDEKICSIKDLRKSLFDNFVMVKKNIKSQTNAIVNLLKFREQKLCSDVEDMYNDQNLYIQEELCKLHSAYAQYHTIYENLTNFKADTDIFMILEGDLCFEDLEETAPKELIVFDATFDDLKSAAQTFGKIKCIPVTEITPSHASGSSDLSSGKHENKCTIRGDNSQNTADILEYWKDEMLPFQTKARDYSSLNISSNTIDENPIVSTESFEVIDSPEDLLLQSYVIESTEHKNEGVRICESPDNLNTKSFFSNSSNKSVKISDWLDESSKMKDPAVQNCIPVNKLEKNEIEDSLSQFTKQLQKVVLSDIVMLTNNIDCNNFLMPTCVRNRKSRNTESPAACNIFQKKACSILLSDDHHWLQSPVSHEPPAGNRNLPMYSEFLTKKKECSPSECIVQAFSSYLVKDDAAKWLCRN